MKLVKVTYVRLESPEEVKTAIIEKCMVDAIKKLPHIEIKDVRIAPKGSRMDYSLN